MSLGQLVSHICDQGDASMLSLKGSSRVNRELYPCCPSACWGGYAIELHSLVLVSIGAVSTTILCQVLGAQWCEANVAPVWTE